MLSLMCCMSRVTRMLRQSGAMALAALALAQLATPAVAGEFSPPLPLPTPEGEGWTLAVSDRGEAVAVSESGEEEWCAGWPRPPLGRLVLLRILPSGRIEPVQSAAVPGFFHYDGRPTAAVDDQGRVAVGLSFEDGTSPSGCEYHDSDCCRAVAFATATATRGPVVQVLRPRRSEIEGLGTDPLEVPEVALQHGRLTVVWPQGRGEGIDERVDLEQAAGPFGAPIKTAVLATVPGSAEDLTLVGTPTPFLGWISDRLLGDGRTTSRVYGVAGTKRGLLTRHQPSRDPVGFGDAVFGTFATDAQGSVAFVYSMSREFAANAGSIMMLTSTGGRRFSAPRTIAHVVEGHGAFVMGDHGRALLLWQDEAGRTFALRGTARGRFGKWQYVGRQGPVLPEFDHAGTFIDSKGRAVVVYNRSAPSPAHPAEAVVASGAWGHSFSRPRRLGPRGCRYGPVQEDTSTLAVSPDGHALIPLECAHERMYVVRYAP